MTHRAAFLEALPVRAVLDGELVALDNERKPDFPTLCENVLHRPTTARLVFMAFDVLSVEGVAFAQSRTGSAGASSRRPRVRPRRRPSRGLEAKWHRLRPWAVENDYNLLVHSLNELETTISMLRTEVEARRLREAREQLEPNETDWVNLIGLQLGTVAHIFEGLQVGVGRVLDSQPGEAVFTEQPPPAPDAP
jgi:hypothetical protein